MTMRPNLEYIGNCLALLALMGTLFFLMIVVDAGING